MMKLGLEIINNQGLHTDLQQTKALTGSLTRIRVIRSCVKTSMEVESELIVFELGELRGVIYFRVSVELFLASITNRATITRPTNQLIYIQ